MIFIKNREELTWMELGQDNFGVARSSLSQGTAAQKIACAIYRLEPGKKSFPFHFHHNNEEAIYVLEGQGTLRLGGNQLPVKAGDYIPFPVGRSFAHQLINESEAPLQYLCLSTQEETDILEYPDSNKLGLWAGAKPGTPPNQWDLYQIHAKGAKIGYYEGEE